MDRAFLVLGALFGFLGVAFGAFGGHAVRTRLTPERRATFETGVRYQLVHALALFAVVLVDVVRFGGGASSGTLYAFDDATGWPIALAGWLFVAGVVLFSGSLYVLSLTGKRAWGAVTPFGGLCLLGGWIALVLAAWTR
jgi:uncharacterized membrane protein YgdD (TMEM256/DUF423 family)